MSTAKHSPVIMAGFSSQILAEELANQMSSRVIHVTRKQFDDKEIRITIEENVRGLDVVVVASGSGAPNKQEKEARLLMRAASRAGAKIITLVIPYMWYGRSDDNWDERNSPALIDTIETLRDHCHNVVVADPHNAVLTREKFLDKGGSSLKTCIIVHFGFPFAVQLKYLVDNGYINQSNLMLAHADAGSVKRISRSFRASLYGLLFPNRSSDEDDWEQGIKDRDKKSGKQQIKGFSCDVSNKDVVIFEDMIGSGGTACDLAWLLKKKGARSVVLFATSGLFSTNPDESPIASIERVNQSQLDAVFITDTFNHKLTCDQIHRAIEMSPIIHQLKIGPYLALILRALHLEAGENSVSSILRGTHQLQLQKDNKIASSVQLKEGNPLRLSRAQ